MNIGILGAGNIAALMAQTIGPMEEAVSYAIAARSLDKARAFAEKYGFEKAYGSYEDMLNDPAVELVYVATPHSHHYEHVKLCLSHGKHVLCEKSFTANAGQAKEIIAMAEEKGLLLTEAIWTRYMPMRKTLDDVIASGVIGEPHSLTANLGYVLGDVERMLKPELAGGALLDLGVYVINFASMVFGTDIKSVTSACSKTDTGVDAINSICIIYNDGKLAQLYTDMLDLTDREGVINGTKGYIKVQNINNCEGIEVYNLDRECIAKYETPKQITGYEYEVMAAMRDIKAGKLECEEMPHQETIRIMEFMDALRAEWGIKYPFE